MTDELKPCPRCKSMNVFWRDGAYRNFIIKCENCGLQTPEYNLDGEIQFDTYEGVKDWWNHRYEDDLQCDPVHCYYHPRPPTFSEIYWSNGMDGHHKCEVCGMVVPNYVNDPRFIHRYNL